VRTLRDVSTMMPWLQRGKHPFNSVIVDSLSELQKRLVDEVAGVDQLQLQDWGTVFRRGEQMVRQFRDLVDNPVKPLYCVVFVSLTRDVGDRDLTHKPYVQGQLGLTLPGFTDVVGALRLYEEDGAVKRRLLVAPIGGYVAKDRTGKLGTVVEDPDIIRMFRQIYASPNGAQEEGVA
jgi:AAA domain